MRKTEAWSKKCHAYLFANQKQALDNASPIGSPVLMEVVFHRVDGNLLTCFGLRGGDFLNVAGAICMLTAKEGRTSDQNGVQTRDRNCVMLGMPQQPQQPQPLSIYVLSIFSSLETCSINFVLTKWIMEAAQKNNVFFAESFPKRGRVGWMIPK